MGAGSGTESTESRTTTRTQRVDRN